MSCTLTLQFSGLPDKMTWEELAAICWRFGQLTIVKMIKTGEVMTVICHADVQTCISWCDEVNWPYVNIQFNGRWTIVKSDYSNFNCIIA